MGKWNHLGCQDIPTRWPWCHTICQDP